jgi:WD40 repeat protein
MASFTLHDQEERPPQVVYTRRGLPPVSLLASYLPSDGEPPRPHRLVSSGVDGALEVWDAQSGGHLRTLQGHTAPVSCVVTYQLRPSEVPRIASGDIAGAILLWDGDTYDLVSGLATRVRTVRDLYAYEAEGGRPRVVSAGGSEICVYDGETGEVRHVLGPLPGGVTAIRGFALEVDGLVRQRVVACGYFMGMCVYGPEAGEMVMEVEGHGELVRALGSFETPFQSCMVSTGDDCTAKVSARDGPRYSGSSLRLSCHELVRIPECKRQVGHDVIKCYVHHQSTILDGKG